MLIKSINNIFANVANKVSLRTIIIIPFVLQIVGAVGLVGYLSFRNGRQAVNDVASQLRGEISDRVKSYLNTYLATPHLINRLNVDSVSFGHLNFKKQSEIERFLFLRLKQFDLSAINFIYGSEQGKLIAIYRDQGKEMLMESAESDSNQIRLYNLDARGNRRKLLSTFRQPDVRQRPWYKAAKKAGKATWSPIFQLGDNSDMTINANHPIYDHTNNKMLGVFASNLDFKEINIFLNSLRVGKSGKIFIMERNGLMVATSGKSKPYIVNNQKQFKRLKVTDSKDALISATSRYLNTHFGDFTKITVNQQLEFIKNGERQFVQIMPFRDKFGLDWLIVVVVPELDFMEQINAHTYTTILLCAATLIVSTGIGIFTARWITEPILRLNSSAKDIAQGEWSKTLEIERSDEVGQLAKSFNSMAAQLQASFAALKESESRLTQFLEALPVGVSVHDLTGKLTYANPTAKQLMGIETLPDATTEELATAYYAYLSGTEQLYPVEQMPIVRAISGESSTADNMELHLSDRIVPLEVWATPIYAQTGKIVSAIAGFIDITERQQVEKILADYNHTLEFRVMERTAELKNINEKLEKEISERKQVEKALRESEERFLEIAQTINQFFFIRSVSSGQYIYASPAYEKMWGRTCESLYEDPLSWTETLHPDDREMILNSLEEPFTGNSVEREYRIIHSDGSIRWIIVEVSAIRDETGQLLRCVGFAQDITERKQAEDALRNSEAQNLALINAIPDLMIRMTRNGTYLDFKPAKNFKTVVSGNDFIGKSIFEIMPLEVSQQRMQYVEQAFSTGEPQSYEFQLELNSKIHEQEARIIVCGKNEVLVIVRDITARKQAEEALRQLTQQEQAKAQELELTLKELKSTQAQLIHAEKMSSLGQMVAGIAHEINNPVSFIYGNIIPARNYCQDLLSIIQLYQQTYINPTSEIKKLAEEIDLEFVIEDYSKLLDSMQVGTERIRDIVLSLRNFSRLDEQELKSVDIHQGIDSTLLILQHRLKSNGHQPAINVIKKYAQLPLITCYANQLNQVFMNLLSNAIDALKNQPEPREITICTSVINHKATSAIDQFIRITIADNGSGMSEQVYHKIFDPFFTTKPIGSGTGLGLSISHQIVVEKHQGKLHCNSALGQGTEFIIEIPVICTITD